MTRAHRDPTGLTSHAAAKLARQRLFSEPYYEKDMIIARAGACSGQMMPSGSKVTRGCGGPGHLQPCPGGPMIYEIVRQYLSFMGPINCIESRGDSWLDAIEQLERRRAEDRERYAKERAVAKPKPRRSK